LDSAALIRVNAANHRSRFRRPAQAGGGRVERAGGIDLILDDRSATIAFPRSRRVERGGRRLHLPVEWDRPQFARLALEDGADPAARDRTWRGTPLQRVDHTGATATGAVLAGATRR
jgi:hypothetical protein